MSGHGASLRVECNERSHNGKIHKVGTFREVIGENDERVRIDPPPYRKAQRNRGLQCPVCGLTDARRPENLLPVIAKYMDEGVSCITLKALSRYML